MKGLRSESVVVPGAQGLIASLSASLTVVALAAEYQLQALSVAAVEVVVEAEMYGQQLEVQLD